MHLAARVLALAILPSMASRLSQTTRSIMNRFDAQVSFMF